MTEEADTDLDLLMSMPPDQLTKLDIDRIIAYQRKMRQQREAGVRTRKPKVAAPSKLDVSALLARPMPVTGGAKRRY